MFLRCLRLAVDLSSFGVGSGSLLALGVELGAVQVGLAVLGSLVQSLVVLTVDFEGGLVSLGRGVGAVDGEAKVSVLLVVALDLADGAALALLIVNIVLLEVFLNLVGGVVVATWALVVVVEDWEDESGQLWDNFLS